MGSLLGRFRPDDENTALQHHTHHSISDIVGHALDSSPNAFYHNQPSNVSLDRRDNGCAVGGTGGMAVSDLGTATIATSPRQPDENAAPEEPYPYPAFSYRVTTAFEIVKERRTSPVMHEFLKQTDLILSALHMCTPDDVRELLNQENPPSFEDLVGLKWENTSRVGVYSKAVFEIDALGKPRLDKPHFEYVGSATRKHGGLEARKYTHDHPSEKEKKSFHSYLVHGKVKRSRKFGVLFSVPTHGLTDQEFVAIRQICIVAEAVFAQILGVYSEHVTDSSLHGSVYGNAREVFSWYGACSHFCLLEGVRGLKKKTLNSQPLIDAMFKYMKAVTDEGQDSDTTLVDSSSEVTVVTSATSPIHIAYSNDHNNELGLSKPMSLFKNGAGDHDGITSDTNDSSPSTPTTLQEPLAPSQHPEMICPPVSTQGSQGNADSLMEVDVLDDVDYIDGPDDADSSMEPDTVDYIDDSDDGDNWEDADNTNEIDEIEIAALPGTQTKSFSGIEDPVITAKRHKAKQQHATYMRWIQNMTAEQKDALREFRKLTSRNWRAANFERVNSDEYRARNRMSLKKHRAAYPGRRKIKEQAAWARKTEEEKERVRAMKRIINNRSRIKMATLREALAEGKTQSEAKALAEAAVKALDEAEVKIPPRPKGRSKRKSTSISEGIPREARPVKDEMKWMRQKICRAAQKASKAWKSDAIECNSLLLVWIALYVERHELTLSLGKRSKCNPPDVFFDIAKAKKDHGEIEALKILAEHTNRDIATSLLSSRHEMSTMKSS
ncbi:hypothetical protein ASPCAL02483 [Aspergillus calidoustus]|uniref:Uncharacterized protein n=1 Tax=Aspergillus calidoustus TaxID=454130 RepID=A0A0U5GKP6_ASPCI|nr:hypothetical protein ASPCAL02483 [Aspergillus calidoustus]